MLSMTMILYYLSLVNLSLSCCNLCRVILFSAQVDGLSMSSLMKKGVFEKYKPFFKSDFEKVECFAAALSEAIIPCREFLLRCGMLSATVQVSLNKHFKF